jgi:hypothetical protein
MNIAIHEVREMITALPIKKTNYRWRIATRNRNIGWNECRLEMLKKISELSECNTAQPKLK